MSNEDLTSLNACSEDEKVAYLSIVAHLAGIDGEVSEEESNLVWSICEAAGVSADGTATVIGALEDPSAHSIDEHIEELENTGLPLELIRDLYLVALSDSVLLRVELDEIEKLARRFGVENGKLTRLRGLAEWMQMDVLDGDLDFSSKSLADLRQIVESGQMPAAPKPRNSKPKSPAPCGSTPGGSASGSGGGGSSVNWSDVRDGAGQIGGYVAEQVLKSRGTGGFAADGLGRLLGEAIKVVLGG